MNKRRQAILRFVLLLHTALVAQYQVKNYYSLTGKKDVAINFIAQDHNGLLWLATPEGAYTFDGKTAQKAFPDYPQLNRDISCIFIDSRDRVWLGTRGGEVFFSKQGKVDSLRFGAEANRSRITSFTELGPRLIFSTYGNGVFILANDSLSQLNHLNGLSDDVVYKVIDDNLGKVWCATDAGISELRFKDSGTTIHIISDKNGLPDNIVRDIFLDGDKLCVAMQDSGLCFFDHRQNVFRKTYFFDQWSNGAVINAFTYRKEKTIIATEKEGLFLFKNSMLSLLDYKKHLQCSAINQAFVDREQQVWLASRKGLTQVGEKRHQFLGLEQGLENGNVLALAIDNDRSLWIGTSSGIAKGLRDEKGELRIESLPQFNKYSITCAAKAPDGDVWFGTYGQGIVVLNTRSGNHVLLNTEDDKISDNNISHLFFSDKNTLYISTLGGGLVRAKVNLEEEYKVFDIDRVYTEADGLGSNYVYASVTDKDGRLYAATDGGGLQKFENGKFTNLVKTFGYASNTVFSLCVDSLKRVWAVSNADGLLCYTGKSLLSYGIKHGLRDIQPEQILCVGEYLYAVHNKGVDRMHFKDSHVSYFDFNVEDLEPNLNALVCFRNELYSGNGSGILLLRTSKESFDSIPPKVFLKGVELNYKPIRFDSAFRFPYHLNSFSFTFDGIWLRNPDKLKFRYKLHGFDEDWSLSDEGKEVSYNNLDPGNYTFIVQAQNEEEVWSEPYTYSFFIDTPIWKRWWFWLLCILASGAAVTLFLRYRLRALQKENLILEVKVRERTAQIEQQSRIIELKNIELEQLSLVASKTDNVVLILDAEGNLEYINESFSKLVGLNKEETVSKYGPSIYDISNHPGIRGIVREAIENKRSVNYETLNTRTASGQMVWQSSTLTPIFDNQGRLRKIIIIDTDVTEQKVQEQIIFQKNKDITDSISYARKIQHSILPPDSLIRKHLPDSFVLYLTKDIVSGDFYWFSHLKDFSILAAVDCTGHGVPGAFMSLIGYNLLNKIVNEQKIYQPGDILYSLNQGVIDALYRNETESKDGMDIAICKINHRDKALEYAGAMRPLWLIENGVLSEIKGDKIPIGTKPGDRQSPIQYKTHLFPLNGNSHFYIFTDGYADQFGGPKEKKYSTGKFKELLLRFHALHGEEQARLLNEEHLNWKGKYEQVDDILVIGLKC